MKRLVAKLGVGLLVACAGCGAKSVDDFRKGLPSNGSVKIEAPQKAGALVGDTATWYLVTLGATLTVNGGTLAVLDVLHNIVANPPTSHPSAKVYVWGPGQGNPLDPLSYRLTVTDAGGNVFTYNLDAKGKADPDSAFVTILSGTHTAVVVGGKNDEAHGSGSFLLDWDKRKALAIPPNDAKGRPLQGTWDFTYDHHSADVKVDVAFNNVLNDDGKTTNSAYHYLQTAGADGLFQFSTTGDVNHNGTSEFVTIESRWHQDGSGRADIRVTQGDVPAGQSGNGNQCWDASFKETFATWSVPTAAGPIYSATEGAASGCSFNAAEYFSG